VAVLLAVAMMPQWGVPGGGLAHAELLKELDGGDYATPSEAAVSDFFETKDLEALTATPSNAEVSLSVETASPSNACLTLAEGKHYSASEGSSDVTNLRVPTLAYDDTSITLVWDKPENYADVANYYVYLDDVKIGDAKSNFASHADWASVYMKAFYDYYQEKDIDMVNVDIHSFRADRLEPDTGYNFSVVAVDAAGEELGGHASISCSTTSKPEVFDITDYGAKPSEEGFTSSDEEKNSFTVANTKAIQDAIDACSEGGKVVVPKGIFMTGALYLKSNMTLELSEGAVLFGSPNVDHYDQNYLLYPYSTDTRSWALINTYSADEEGGFENIRIVGKGTIYGNGWKYGTGTVPASDGNGYLPAIQSRQSGDPDWTNGEFSQYALKGFVGRKDKNYNDMNLGILAKSAFDNGKSNGLSNATAYATRPNLIVLRNVNGVYIEGITAENPAFHTIAVLDSENVVSENVKYITYDANNADGIELGNTQNAMVFNNFFDTGDDGINFATGMGKGVQDTDQKPSSDIWTFNNFLRECHGGAIAAGSHTGAGIGSMLVEDNVLNHSDMPFRFKSAPVNGGGIYDVLIRDCAVGDAEKVFTFNTTYSDANQAMSVEPADKPAEFYNIDAFRITADTITKNTIDIVADVDDDKPYKPAHTHHDLYFQDITFTNIDTKLAKSSEILTGASNVTFNNVVMNWKDIEKGSDDAAANTYKAWANIKACSDLNFIGTTTQSVNSYAAMSKPVWPEDAAVLASASEATKSGSERKVTLKWPAAKDGDQVAGKGEITGYIVETYLSDELIDKTKPVSGTSCEIGGLSPDTCYLFKVYGVDNTGNRTPELAYELTTTEGENPELKEPESSQVAFSGVGYTWATAKIAASKDKRVRGYRAYVDGDLTATVYKYQLADPDASNISMTIGRIMEDSSEITVEAFSDTDLIYEYKEKTVKTMKSYDYKAPEWESDALKATISGENVLLSWKAPEDESGIYAYRVYVDEKPVYTTEGDYFNHVNGKYTTTDAFYTVNNLDLSVPHTFRVEAADNWWRAKEGSGPFHWTRSGPEVTWDGSGMVQKAMMAKMLTGSETLWKSAAFGQSTDLNFVSNVLEDKVGTNYTWPVDSDVPLGLEEKPVQDVVIESRGGKLQAGHDGITFYYTEVPTSKNFALTADVTVEKMGPENGTKPNLQEGAGLMVRDVNGPPRKDPLEEGYEEYPAASNMVMLEVGAAGKSLSADLNLLAAARYGVNSPAGNLKTVKTTETFGKSVGKADKSGGKTNSYNTELKLKLERTDSGFTTSYLDKDGKVISRYTFKDKNVTPNIVSHLDEEMMNVGFFASRNARITVKNITLDLTDVITPDESPAYVAPDDEGASLYVASGEYSNSREYMVQALTNQSGSMTVSQDGTEIVSKADVIGGEQFKAPAVLSESGGEFSLTFVPSEGADAGKQISKTFQVKREDYGKNLYVSPEGSDSATGTASDPMSIDMAIKKLVPSGIIFMNEGTYQPIQIPLTASGNEHNRKNLTAIGKVTITGNLKIFVLDSDYWNVLGLDVDGKNVENSRGVMIHGSYNCMRDSLIHNTSSDAGLTITKSRGSRSLWPSNNVVDNCESYENKDGSMINADGFASKSGSGDNNRFINCVSHDNADDGWDLYNTLSDGPNGRAIIENCVAYNNGNNGFKLGGEGREVSHILRNSVAFHNTLDGITDNFNPGELRVENNTSFDNRRFNIILRPSPYKKDADGNLTADGIFKNNVSYRTADYSAKLKTIYGDKIAASEISNNYLYTETGNSIGEENFLSLDPAACYYRDNDKIMFGNFLRPKRGSVIRNAGAGAVLPGIDEPESEPEPEPEPEPIPNPVPNPSNYDSDSDSDRDYGISIPYRSEEVEGDWKQDENGWRLKKKDGTYPKDEWAKVNGVWYFFGQTGYMTTGWKQVEGKWYYLASDGGMQTNWVLNGENWYFMNADGSMAIGWVMVNDSWYYLNQSGECLLNTVTPDGYRVDEKGARVKS
jgi:polygalacturonase